MRGGRSIHNITTERRFGIYEKVLLSWRYTDYRGDMG